MKCEFFEGVSSVLTSFLFCLILVMPTAIVGCSQKEKVLDIETPNAQIEVERDVKTGETDVEVNREAPATTSVP